MWRLWTAGKCLYRAARSRGPSASPTWCTDLRSVGTAAVHSLLRHLEAVGFDGAPPVLAIDGKHEVVRSLKAEPAFASARRRSSEITGSTVSGACSKPVTTLSAVTVRHLKVVHGWPGGLGAWICHPPWGPGRGE